MSHPTRWIWILAVNLLGSTGLARDQAPRHADDPCARRVEACEFFEAPALVISRHDIVISPESPVRTDPHRPVREALNRLLDPSRGIMAQILDDRASPAPFFVGRRDLPPTNASSNDNELFHDLWSLLMVR